MSLVWLELAPELVLARIRSRGAMRDAAKLRDEAALLATLDLAPPVVPHLRLDASRPVRELAELVLGAVRS